MGLFGLGRRRRERTDAELKSRLDTEQLIRELAADSYRTNNRLGLEAVEALRGKSGRRLGGGQPPMEQAIISKLVDRGLQPPEDPLATLLKLRQLDREDKEWRRANDDDREPENNTRELLAMAAAALAPVIARMFGSTAPAAAVEYPPAALAFAPAAPLPAAFAPVAVGGPAPKLQEFEPQMPTSIIPQDAFSPGQVLDHLEADEPAEFAAWLLAQPYGPQLAADFVAQPIEQVQAQLALAAASPARLVGVMHPVYVWLHQHPDRGVAIVVALGDTLDRRQKSAGTGL